MLNFLDELKTIVAQHPTDTSALGKLADAYRNQGNVNEALTCYEKLLDIQPNNYQALNNYGALLRSAGDYVKSARVILQANEILQNNPIILTNLSQTYTDMGRFDMAVESAERAVKIQPDFIDANVMLGRAFLKKAEYEKAMESFNIALKLKPGDKALITLLARTYSFSGDVKTAYKLIKPLLEEKYVACIPAYFLMSKKLGLYDDAAQYTESILTNEKDGNEPASLHFHLGKYYDYKGLYDKAFLHYQKGNKLTSRPSKIKDPEKEFNEIATLFSRANNKRSDQSSITS